MLCWCCRTIVFSEEEEVDWNGGRERKEKERADREK